MKSLNFLLIVLTVIPAFSQDAPTEFNYPLAVTATADGIIYVADRNLPGVWKIEGGSKSIYFQGSKKFRTPLNAVRCLAIDHEGHLLAGDSSTRDVYRFDDQAAPQPLTDGWIGIPMAMAVAPDGTIYTADLELHRIWKMPKEGAKEPEEFAVINSPRGLTLDPDGNLWVLSTSSRDGQIQKVTPDGRIEPFVKGHPFNLPHNIVRMDDGSFFVTDNYEHCVWKVTAAGEKEKWVVGEPLDRPVGLARSGANLLIADPHIRTIFSLAPDRKLTVIASSPDAASQVNQATVPYMLQTDENDATGELEGIYEACLQRAGYVANILKVQRQDVVGLQNAGFTTLRSQFVPLRALRWP